jgi:ABC-type molybdate transport system substrate-binding protein
VRQALTYAERRAVDAAIVYATDARIVPDVVALGDVPGADGLAIETVAVRTTGGASPAAEAFLAHLRSDAVRAVLVRAGFGLPPP